MPTDIFPDVDPDLHQPAEELETPVVVADRDVMERNMHEFADMADEHGVGLRVHTKAHKTPEIAIRQQELAPDGVLCQKLGEAEVMAKDGVDDILLVCPVVNEPKVERAVWLAEKCDHFAMMVDGPANVDPLNEVAGRRDTTVDVVMEVDVGLERMGVQPGEEAVAFGDHLRDLEHVRLHGLLGHDGHLAYFTDDEDELEALCADVAADLGRTAELLEDAGVADAGDLTVTSGASATAPYMANQNAITELDPGRYLFNDAGLLKRAPHVGPEDCALTVLTTVIATPAGDRAICDAGSKTVSYIDSPDPVHAGDAEVGFPRRSSEHGHLDVSGVDVAVGDRLEFVVPNGWSVINLHDSLPVVSDERVVDCWNVEARGKVQ